jgi:hypothetical protein
VVGLVDFEPFREKRVLDRARWASEALQDDAAVSELGGAPRGCFAALWLCCDEVRDYYCCIQPRTIRPFNGGKAYLMQGDLHHRLHLARGAETRWTDLLMAAGLHVQVYRPSEVLQL